MPSSSFRGPGRLAPSRRLGLILALLALLFAAAPFCAPGAFAVQKIVRLATTDDAIDLASAIEYFSGTGDKLQVATAPGPDGIVRRIEVGALQAGANPHWMVFALTNDTDEQLTRLLVVPHYRFVGSGVVWPDLGSARIATITASQGDPPEREDVAEADAFRLSIDPGSTITYVAELRTSTLPQVYLWEPDAYKANVASLTLYRGIVIGIAGLLALFMTIVFVVRGVLVFPAAAALAWAVFAYVCIDFGFWQKIFGFDDATERIWRAAIEASIGATLIVFMFTYLNLRRWHARFLHIGLAWMLAMAIVVGLSVYNPAVAAGVARISIASVAAIGLMLILTLAARGSDRAILLIPDVVPARRLGHGGGGDGARLCLQRPRLARPHRRAGADRHADRLHHHADRLLGLGRAEGARRGLRAAGAGDDGNRRRDLRLGRHRRPHLRERRGGDPSRPEARRARRAGRQLAGRAAPARPRPLFGRARRSLAATLGPHPPRSQAARRRRSLHLVPAEGAPRSRRQRRRGPGDRLLRGRDRNPRRRGAHPARRHSRPPDGTAEPRIVLRPAGERRHRGAAAGRSRPRRRAVRHRPAGGDQRHARHVVRQFRAADHRPPRRARPEARRYARPARRRPFRRHPAARGGLRPGRLRRLASRSSSPLPSASATAKFR